MPCAGSGAGAGAQGISCLVVTHSTVTQLFSKRVPRFYPAPLSQNLSLSLSLSISRERGCTRFQRGCRYPTITSAIKRFKDRYLDDVIQGQKKLKLVTKLKHVLLKQPQQKISLRELAKYRKHLGLLGRRRLLPILRRYTALFQVYEEEEAGFSVYVKLTPQAHDLHLEEVQIKSQIEHHLHENLRKLLMMSATKRVLLEKISITASDMGLPMDFKSNICRRYPQFFRVIETDYGPALELTSWDPTLAVSAAEKKKLEAEEDEDLIIPRPGPRKFDKINLPKGCSLSRKNRDYILQFQEMPFSSPYSDCKAFEPGSMEAEKHACSVVHELLNLTVEKKMHVDHLTRFRYDFKFPNKVRAILLRHPELFYVSFKGDRDSVFLREAYRDSELIEKSPLLLVQEKLRALMLIRRRHATEVLQHSHDNDFSLEEEEDEEEEEGEEEEEDFESDEENLSHFDGSASQEEEEEEEEVRLAPKPEFPGETKLFEAPAEKDLATVALDVSRERW